MKKVIGIIAVIAAIGIIGMSISNNIASQPAQVIKVSPTKTTTSVETTVSTETTSESTSTERKKREGFFCVANGNGTVTYGSASWSGWWIFGHWSYGEGITMPGGQSTCDAFLEGVTVIQAP
ncbi:MAG: hypothetical protein KBB91_00660 [Candidatus Pacebacteria bacterium]|jgi:hypothetical protein|nr:hypothetical protein [Candidatus Paceibacterota bacterium]